MPLLLVAMPLVTNSFLPLVAMHLLLGSDTFSSSIALSLGGVIQCQYWKCQYVPIKASYLSQTSQKKISTNTENAEHFYPFNGQTRSTSGCQFQLLGVLAHALQEVL